MSLPDDLPADIRPPCSRPRDLTDDERLQAADVALRVIRKEIAKTVRELRERRRVVADLEKDLDALIAAEDAAIAAMKEATG